MLRRDPVSLSICHIFKNTWKFVKSFPLGKKDLHLRRVRITVTLNLVVIFTELPNRFLHILEGTRR